MKREKVFQDLLKEKSNKLQGSEVNLIKFLYPLETWNYIQSLSL